MKRVLVTGARGFIGRHALVPLMARGYEVHAVTTGSVTTRSVATVPTTHPQGQAEATPHWHVCDLLDERAVWSMMREVAPTHVLHFAWYVEHGQFWQSPLNEHWLRATVQLMGAFAAQGGRRFVGAGTCAEYDWTRDHEGKLLCDEHRTPLQPATPYGRAKLDAWQAVRAIAHAYRMSAAWGRIFHAYGPGEAPGRLVASIILALLRGQAAQCTHGEQIRDLLYVGDVADAFVALLDSDVQDAVNIGSGNPQPLKTIMLEIGQQMGKPQDVLLGALPARSQEPALLVPHTARLNNEVGWRSGVSLTQGIQQTIQWWKGVNDVNDVRDVHDVNGQMVNRAR